MNSFSTGIATARSSLTFIGPLEVRKLSHPKVWSRQDLCILGFYCFVAKQATLPLVLY